MAYWEMLLGLSLDLIAISVLVSVVYFPRHQRRDLILPFVGLNVGLFAVAVFAADRELNLAVGLGLFALLSVVRLRSSEIAQEDIAYYFVALVLGLINGFARQGQWPEIATIDAILVATMFVADHPRVFGGRQRYMITIDKIYTDDTALRSAIEKELHAEVTRVIVQRIDLEHGRMLVDARVRAQPPK